MTEPEQPPPLWAELLRERFDPPSTIARRLAKQADRPADTPAQQAERRRRLLAALDRPRKTRDDT